MQKHCNTKGSGHQYTGEGESTQTRGLIEAFSDTDTNCICVSSFDTGVCVFPSYPCSEHVLNETRVIW